MMRKIILLFIGVMLFFPFKAKAVDTSATSAIMMDIDSNRILYSKNIHNIRSVASISKIMTAHVAIKYGKIDKQVIIGDEILKAYGSGIYIKQGEKMTLLDLLYGLMLRSGNDAALSIAKNVAGSTEKFVELMNKEAQKIGMKNTTFNNPSGLDEEEGNYSTAYDMALLMSEAMKNTTFQKITKTKVYKLNTNKSNYVWNNKNKLLKTYKYTTGGKTGFTVKARRTLVTTASYNNLNLVVVTLNDGNDFKDHQSLFEYGFKNYQSYQILKKGIFNIPEDDYYEKYNFYIKNDFKYATLKNEKDNIVLKITLDKQRNINLKKAIGKIDVLIGDEAVHTEDVYIQKKENKKNFIDKLVDWINSL